MKTLKKTILIVEDDFFLAQTLRDRFEFIGYKTAIAENGEAALAYLASSPADLILMDVLMPGMDGLTATRQIKANPRWKKIPVIVLTAKARPEDERESRAAGADDYMAKPFNVHDLVKKVETWISK